MFATLSKLQSFRSYTPDVERRRHVCSDSPGLTKLNQLIREEIIAHDRLFLEPREGFHNAQLLDHVENVEAISEQAGRLLGLNQSDLFVVGQIGFYHDLSKTDWHAHRIDGKLPVEEIPNRDGHDRLSWGMLFNIAREVGLTVEEWETLWIIGRGVEYHHHPECLAEIAKQSRLFRELRMTTIVHCADIYVAIREWRGDSHPALSHVRACAILYKKLTEEPRYEYLRQGEAIPAIFAALSSAQIERAYDEAVRSQVKYD